MAHYSSPGPRRLINVSSPKHCSQGDIVEGTTINGDQIKGEFISWSDTLSWAYVKEIIDTIHPSGPTHKMLEAEDSDATLPAFTTNAPAAADAPGLGESAGVGYTEMDLVHIEELMNKIQAAVYVWRMAGGRSHDSNLTEKQLKDVQKRRRQALITIREEVFRWVREEESRVLPAAMWNETC